MGNKLYVGNLSYSMNDESLSQLFSQAGTVDSAKVIVENHSGRSKGFGFVEMSTDEEAAEAISKFHETEQDGRKIIVSEARPMVKRDKGGYGGGGGRGGSGGGGGRGGRSW